MEVMGPWVPMCHRDLTEATVPPFCEVRYFSVNGPGARFNWYLIPLPPYAVWTWRRAKWLHPIWSLTTFFGKFGLKWRFHGVDRRFFFRFQQAQTAWGSRAGHDPRRNPGHPWSFSARGHIQSRLSSRALPEMLQFQPSHLSVPWDRMRSSLVGKKNGRPGAVQSACQHSFCPGRLYLVRLYLIKQIQASLMASWVAKRACILFIVASFFLPSDTQKLSTLPVKDATALNLAVLPGCSAWICPETLLTFAKSRTAAA